MQDVNPSQFASEKLKTTFALGLGSNFFTVCGMLVAFIILFRTEWLDGFWNQAFMAFCLGPVLMGDAINSYVLGRIKVESKKGWQDILVTDEGKKAISRFYLLWRGLSLLSTLLFSAVLLTSLSPAPGYWRYFKYAFFGVFPLHLLRCLHMIQAYYAPKVRSFGGWPLIKKAAVLGFVSISWLCWLYYRADLPFSFMGFILHGTVYFSICASLQPLPSRFSIFNPRSERNRKISFNVESVSSENIVAELTLIINPLAASWRSQFAFESLGYLRMPLLELPLFEAVGEAFLSSEKTELLLFLKTSIRERVHRVLISWFPDKVLISTDFGANQARFPANIAYKSVSQECSQETFLDAHKSVFAEKALPITVPPWTELEKIVQAMICFLQKEVPRSEIVRNEIPGTTDSRPNQQEEPIDKEKSPNIDDKNV